MKPIDLASPKLAQKNNVHNFLGKPTKAPKKEELYIIKGEIFEFSGLDLITAEIDHKTLKFKK